MVDYSKIPEHLADKLRKLLALQEGTTNEHEASNAAARVQELLLKYNLDINNLDREAKIPIIETYIHGYMLEVKNEGEWIKELLYQIGEFYFCKVLGRETKRGRIYSLTIIGEEINVQLLRFVHEQLLHKVRYMAKEAVKNYEGNKLAFKRAYYMGAVSGIYSKLSNERYQQQKNNIEGYGLILKKRDNIQEYLDEKNRAWLEKYKPTLDAIAKISNAKALKPKKEKPYNPTAGKYSVFEGRNKGYEDGKNIKIDSGLNASKNHKTT